MLLKYVIVVISEKYQSAYIIVIIVLINCFTVFKDFDRGQMNILMH